MSEKIIDRIKKLLSLSESTNENEAALAAARAAELMLKHEIKAAQLCEEEQEDVDTIKIDESKQIVNWKANLMGGLANSLGCMFFLQKRRQGGKVVTRYNVAGQPSKVDTISYMYAYLVAEINRLADICYRRHALKCRSTRMAAPPARSWKNAFRLGAAETIGARLKAQREETHKAAEDNGQGAALVVVKDAEKAVDMYVAKKYPKMGRTAGATFSSGSGYGAGKEAGKSVGLGGTSNAIGSGSKQLGAG